MGKKLGLTTQIPLNYATIYESIIQIKLGAYEELW
jgi:hypothetical protein